MNEENLKVGDTIIEISSWSGLSKIKITKVSNTLITLSNGERVRKPIEGRYAIGSSGYRRSYYRNPTPELLEQYAIQEKKFKLSKLISELSIKKVAEDDLDMLTEVLTKVLSKTTQP